MFRPVALSRFLPYLVDAAIAKAALLAFNQCGTNSLDFGGRFLRLKLPFTDQLANHLAFVTVMSRIDLRLDPTSKVICVSKRGASGNEADKGRPHAGLDQSPGDCWREQED